MLKIAVLNEKGGVGKTTTALNLAAAFHLEGRRTILVDLDPQKSAYRWAGLWPDPSPLDGLAVTSQPQATNRRLLSDIARGYDVVILDGPPRLGKVTEAAAVFATHVLLPIQPGPFDMWASEETMALLDDADRTREELGLGPVARAFLLNRAIKRTRLSESMPALLEHKGVLAGVFYQRQDYVTAAAYGASVLTLEPHGEASREVRKLARALGAPVQEGGAA